MPASGDHPASHDPALHETGPPDTALAIRLFVENTWRRRHLLAAVAAATAAPFLALAIAIAPRYVSTSTLVLLLGPEYTARAPAGSALPPSLAFDPDHILGNESAIIDGDDLHRDVIRRIGIDRLYPALLAPPSLAARAVSAILGLPDALATLAGSAPPRRAGHDDTTERALAIFDARFDAAPSKNASVLTLSFTHRDPAVAAETLRTIERLYLRRRRDLYGEQQLAPLRDEVAGARADLAGAEAALAGFRHAHAISDYTTELDILLHGQGDLEADGLAAGRDAAASRARVASLSAQLAGLPAMVSGGSDNDLDAQTASTRASLDTLEAERAATLARFRPDSPEAGAIESQITRRRDELAAAATARHAVSGTHTVRNGTRDTVLASLLAAETDAAAAGARTDADRAALAGLAGRIGTLGAAERRLDELTDARDARLESYRTLSASLSDEAKDEAVEARALPGARIATEANLPTRPKPLRLLLAAAGLVFALFATFAAALLLHAGRRVILFADEIERTGLVVLGRIPRGDRLAAAPPIRPVMPRVMPGGRMPGAVLS